MSETERRTMSYIGRVFMRRLSCPSCGNRFAAMSTANRDADSYRELPLQCGNCQSKITVEFSLASLLYASVVTSLVGLIGWLIPQQAFGEGNLRVTDLVAVCTGAFVLWRTSLTGRLSSTLLGKESRDK